MVTQDDGTCGLATLTPHRWLRSVSELTLQAEAVAYALHYKDTGFLN